MNWTIQQALQQAAQLAEISDTARIDVTALLCHVLEKDRAFLYAWPEQSLTDTQQASFAALLERRRRGEPIAYLIGEREFWSLPLRVSSATLIPRPDTELLVTTALELFSPADAIKMLDLGTGTGAIAIALAAERPEWHVTALDNSDAALAVARSNAEQLDLPQIKFLRSDWFAQVGSGRFELIVSNPPYIQESDPHLTQGDLRFEPTSALASGTDGLRDLRVIISQAPDHLATMGWLAVEHGYQQGAAVRELFAENGFSAIGTQCDLAGLERVTCGQFIG